MGTNNTAIYLSPHLDDAVLSCCGAIARRVKGGARVVVATVFTADRPGLDDLTGHLDAAWGASAESPLRLRRRQDLAALRRLGAQPLWLGQEEAIARSPARYLDEAQLHGEIAGEEAFAAELLELVRDLIAAWPAAELVAPLGVGDHVDHLLVHAAARAMERERAVAYYEDMPYAADDAGALARRLDALGGRTGFVAEVVEIADEIDAKAAAARLYHASSEEWAEEALSAYARQVGNGAFAERTWRPLAATCSSRRCSTAPSRTAPSAVP